MAYWTDCVGDDLDVEVSHGVVGEGEREEVYKSVANIVLGLGSTTSFVSSGVRHAVIDLADLDSRMIFSSVDKVFFVCYYRSGDASTLCSACSFHLLFPREPDPIGPDLHSYISLCIGMIVGCTHQSTFHLDGQKRQT